MDVQTEVAVSAAAEPVHAVKGGLREAGVGDGTGADEGVGGVGEEVLEERATGFEFDGCRGERGCEGRVSAISAIEVLSGARHGPEDDGLTPIHSRVLGPDVLAKEVSGVIEFIVAVNIAFHLVYLRWSVSTYHYIHKNG